MHSSGMGSFLLWFALLLEWERRSLRLPNGLSVISKGSIYSSCLPCSFYIGFFQAKRHNHHCFPLSSPPYTPADLCLNATRRYFLCIWIKRFHLRSNSSEAYHRVFSPVRSVSPVIVSIAGSKIRGVSTCGGQCPPIRRFSKFSFAHPWHKHLTLT
jgi:hypothetical protein